MFLLNITGEGDNEKYHFTPVDKKGKFELRVTDCKQLIQSIHNYTATY